MLATMVHTLPTTYANTLVPMSMAKMMKNRSAVLVGTTSPYPIVDIVTRA